MLVETEPLPSIVDVGGKDGMLVFPAEGVGVGSEEVTDSGGASNAPGKIGVDVEALDSGAGTVT